MTLRKALLFTIVPWILGVSTLHAWLNLGVFQRQTKAKGQFKVGFLPVT